MFNRTTIAPIVALVFAVLSYLGVGLPASFTPDGVVAAVIAIAAVVALIARFFDGGTYEDVKDWWRSKTVWAAVGTAIIALGALVGVNLGFSVEEFAAAAMMFTTLLMAIFGSGDKAKLA